MVIMVVVVMISEDKTTQLRKYPPKTKQPVTEVTQTSDGAHSKLDANAELYNKDK